LWLRAVDQISALLSKVTHRSTSNTKPPTQEPPADPRPLADLTPEQIRSTLRAFATEQLRRVGPDTPEGKSVGALLERLDARPLAPTTRNTQNRAAAPRVLDALRATAATASASQQDTAVMQQLVEGVLQGVASTEQAARRGQNGQPGSKRPAKAGARQVQQTRPQQRPSGRGGPTA
ncbi:hypothetical protein ACWC5I_22375, partial [Kitasatospora sp. NPDC001574]